MRGLLTPVFYLITICLAYGQQDSLKYQTQQNTPQASLPSSMLSSKWTDVAEVKPLPNSGTPDFAGRCNNLPTLQCGGFVTGNTAAAGSTNSFTNTDYKLPLSADFSAPDRAYRVDIVTKSSVHFVLDILTTNKDLDLILLSSCGDLSSQVVRKDASLEDNVGEGTYREVLDLNLTPGTYYLVVDGYKADQTGSFKVSMTCTCSCLETNGDMPHGEQLLCDDFQGYLVNKTLSPQSSRWRTFVDTIISNTHYRTVDGIVRNEGTNNYAQFQDPPSSSYVDAVYRLDNSTSGRYRVSWKMRVASGKGGYFNILHQNPNGQGNNYAVAYEVFFNSNNTGNLIYHTNGGVKTTIPFKYLNNTWINVVNIIDMDTDKAELWINDNYVSRWQFSFASSPVTGNTPIKKLAGIEFWETTPTTISQDCCVDDLCVWKSTPSNCETFTGGGKVCIENGNKDFEEPARCDLYTSLEWEDCLTVCEYGGTFVYRGTTYTGKLQESDLAPGFVKNDPCVVSAYGGSLPQPFYADVYIFNKQDKLNMQVLLSNQPSTCKVFVFACNYRQGNSCVYGQKCLTNIANTHFTPYTCDSLYYIVVTGAFGNTYNLNIVPQGLCQSSATNMGIDCSTPGLTGFFSENSSVSASPLTGMNTAQAYSKCYGGSRPYTGGERIYKISLRNPAVVEFQLVPQAPMGIVLFTSLCGAECEGALREGNAGDTIRFSRLLYANDYYVVVDKATTAGSLNFNLKVECKGTTNNNITKFIILSCSAFAGENEVKKGVTLPDEYCGCKNGALGPDSTHTVRIENSAYPFSDKDQMQFLVVKPGSVDTTTSSVLYDYYTNIKAQNGFPLQKDISSDTVKCSYSVGERLITSIFNKDDGNQRLKLVKAEFRTPTPTNGLNATDQFLLKGVSSIVRFSLLDSLSNILFATTRSGLEPSATATSDNFTLLSNLKWKTQLLPAVSWITNINPKESLTINNGSNTKMITVSFAPNPDPKPRQTILKTFAANRPGLIYLYMPIVQQANCNFTPTATIVASAPQICKGDTVHLTATVRDQTGKDISDAYAYVWNNGQRTRGIRDTLETTTPGVYTVTVNSPYCIDKSTSKTISVTVLDLPPSPIANAGTNGTMCLGQAPPTSLTVTSGNAATTDVQWFDSPSSATVLTTGTSFTPPQPPAAGVFTYYYQSKYKTTPACVSPRLEAKLTVLPKPTNITVGGKQCADNLLTYGFNITTLTTNAVTIISGTGNLTGGNGQYTINNIAKSTPLTFRVTGANGCFEDRTEEGLACPCVAPPKPSPQSVPAICLGASAPTLSVILPGGNPNWVVDWFAQSQPFAGEIPLKSESSTYMPTPPPNTPGVYTYYAQTRIKNGVCTSTERTELILVVNAKPTIQITDSICEPDLDHYRMTVKTEAGNTLTRTPAVGTLSGGGGGVYTITGIPEGTALSLTASNALTSCFFTTSVPSLHCGCDFVSPPQGPSIRTICANEFLEPLDVTVGKDEIADWYNSNNDLLLPNSTVLPISDSGAYFVLARNTINQCTSALKKITVIINPLPQVILSAPTCATDLLSWSVEFTATGGTPGQPTPSGSLFSNGSGGYSIQNILKSQNIGFTVTNATTGCNVTKQVQAPSCRCEDLPPLTKPVFLKNQSYCPNAPALPALQVKVNVGETVDWYDDLGNLLVAGDTLLIPIVKGTYFATRRNLTNNCISAERTAVVLTEHPLPTLEVTKKDCAANLLTYEVSITSNAEGLITTKGTVTGVKPNFKVIGIPKDTNIIVTATSIATGCQNAQPVSAKKCDCDALGLINLPVPVIANPVVICANDPIPTLIVTVGSANETATWYDSLGNQIAQDTLRFRPAVAGTYYVEARNKNSGCKSDTRLAYHLRINAVPNLIFLDSICNDSLNRYDLYLKTNGTFDVLTTPYFKIFDNTTNTYLVPGILLGDPVALRARFVSTGCKVQQVVKKDECSCPNVVAPLPIKDTVVCKGTYPLLTVSVQNPSLETVDWFDANGILLKPNSLTYQHTKDTSRTYFAQTRYRFNGDCVSPARTAVKVIVNKPVEVKAGIDQEVCEGEKVVLNGSISGGVGTGFWSAPVGSFVPSAAVLNAQYQPPAGTGSISLTLISADPAGPCPAGSDQMTVKIKPKPTFVLGNSVCAANLLTYSVAFTTTATANVSINAGNKQFLGSGNYTIDKIPRDSNLLVTLLDSGSQCTTAFTVSSTGCPCSLIESPQASGNQVICPEDAIPNLTVQVGATQTVDWYDAQLDGNLLKSGSKTFKPQIAVTFTYYAEARDTASGCLSSSRTPVTLTVKPSPTADAGSSASVCPGKSATLSAIGLFDTYLWSTGMTMSDITVAPTATGYYYLTVTLNGCRAVDSVLVTILEAVQGSIGLQSAIKCFGDPTGAIRANATGGAKPYKVLWSLNSSQQPQLSNLAAGAYTVTISDQQGCADTVTYLLTQPDALILSDTTIKNATDGKANGSVNVGVSGGIKPYSYQWLDEVFFEIPNETNEFISAALPGKYAIRVTDANGCSILSGLFEVKNLVRTNDPNSQPVFRLFPNPTDGHLQLQLELPEAMPVEIAVSDITGRVLQVHNHQQTDDSTLEFDLSAYASGVYLLRIRLDNQTFVRKVILEK